MSRISKLAVVTAAVALVAAACGGGATTTTTNDASSPTTSGGDTPTSSTTVVDIPASASSTPTAPSTSEAHTTSTPPSTTADLADDGGSGGSTLLAAGHPTLLAAVDNVEAMTIRAEAFMHMSMNFDGIGFEMGGFDEPFMRMLSSGDRYEMTMDMAAMFGADLLAEMGLDDGSDLSMQMVGDSTVAYMRAPMFSSPIFADDPTATTFSDLGDGWGVIRVDDLADVLGDALPSDMVTAITGQETQGIDQWLDMATRLRLIDEDGVASAVRGVPTTRYSGVLTFTDLLELGGMGGDMFSEAMVDATGDPDAAGLLDMFDELQIEMSIDIDDDGLPRAMSMFIDMGDMFDAMGEAFGEEPPAGMGMTMTTVIEMYEYSDEPVDVTFPSDSEVTADLGQIMVDLLS